MGRLWYEDVQVGARRTTGEYVVDPDDAIDFARRWDPQPFHLDEAAAAESVFGGLTACFAHVFAILSRLMVEDDQTLAVLAGLGFEDTFMSHPVRHGDRLVLEVAYVDKRPSRSKPDRGIVKTELTLRNQRGEPVMTSRGRALVARRPA